MTVRLRSKLRGSSGHAAWVGLLTLLMVQPACTEPCGQETPSYTHERYVVSVSGGIRSKLRKRFHPLCPDSSAQTTRTAMYEPLMVWNPWATGPGEGGQRRLGAYVPRLAEEMSWYDTENHGYRFLRIRLRNDAKWSDGEPITAKDVEATLLLLKSDDLRDSETCPSFDFADVGQRIEEVALVDDPLGDADRSIVEVEFKDEYYPGMFYLARTPIVPRGMIRRFKDGDFDNTNPVGSGPFAELESFDENGEHFYLRRNRHHWSELDRESPEREALRVSHLFVTAMPSNEVAGCALEQGLVDWSGDFHPSSRGEFQQMDPEFHSYWAPPVQGPVLLLLNPEHPPFASEKLRTALRDAFVGSNLSAGLDYFAPISAASGLEIAPDQDRQPSSEAAGRFARELRRAGLEKLDFEIVVPEGYSDWISSVKTGIQARLQSDMADTGIAVDISVAEVTPECRHGELSCWRERVRRGDFQATLAWSEVGPQLGVESGSGAEKQFLAPSPYYFFADLTGLSCSENNQRRPSAGFVSWDDETVRSTLCRFERCNVDRLNACVDGRLGEHYGMKDPKKDGDCQALDELIKEFEEKAPVIPLFMAPAWGAADSVHIEGFPTANDPYSSPSPESEGLALMVYEQLRVRPAD